MEVSGQLHNQASLLMIIQWTGGWVGPRGDSDAAWIEHIMLLTRNGVPGLWSEPYSLYCSSCTNSLGFIVKGKNRFCLSSTLHSICKLISNFFHTCTHSCRPVTMSAAKFVLNVAACHSEMVLAVLNAAVAPY